MTQEPRYEHIMNMTPDQNRKWDHLTARLLKDSHELYESQQLGPDPDAGNDVAVYDAWEIEGHHEIKRVVLERIVYAQPYPGDEDMGYLGWWDVDSYLKGDRDDGYQAWWDSEKPASERFLHFEFRLHWSYYCEDAEGERLYEYDVEDVVGYTEDAEVGSWDASKGHGEWRTIDEMALKAELRKAAEDLIPADHNLGTRYQGFDPLGDYLLPFLQYNY